MTDYQSASKAARGETSSLRALIPFAKPSATSLVRAGMLALALLLGSMGLARLTLTVVAAENAEIVVISLRESVTVQEGVVRVSQVADLDGTQDTRAKMANVVVCRAPQSAVGEEVVSGRVRRALMRAGISSKSFIIEGERVQVYLRDYIAMPDTDAATQAEDAAHASVNEDQPSMGVADTGPAEAPHGSIGVVGAQSEQDLARQEAEAQAQAAKAQANQSEENGLADQQVYRPGQYFQRRAQAERAASGAEAQADANQPVASDVVELVMAEIKRDIAKSFDLPQADIAVSEVRRNSKLQYLPKGVQRLASKKERLNLGSDLGELRYRFSAEVKGEIHDDLVLTVNVVRYASVVVFARDVRSKQPLVESDLMLQRLPFDTKAENYYLSIDDALGMAPTRHARADSIVEPAQLERATLIKRGDIVLVSYRSGSLVIECQAKALSDGARGDVIEMERINPGTNQRRGEKPRPIHARITANGHAEVVIQAASR